MQSTVMLQMPGCHRRLLRTRPLRWQCSWRLQWMRSSRVRRKHASCRGSCVIRSWLYRCAERGCEHCVTVCEAWYSVSGFVCVEAVALRYTQGCMSSGLAVDQVMALQIRVWW